MNPVAMVDLDLTLFDYDGLRRDATLAALSAMGFESDGVRALHFVTDVLIPYGDAFESVGLPNFRRQWNAIELFQILGGLRGFATGASIDAALRHGLEADNVYRGASPPRKVFEHRWHQRHLLQIGESGTAVRALTSMTNLGDERGASIGKQAFDTFIESNARPYPGARELLDLLRDRRFTTVILTEGDEAVQQSKVDILGLRGSVAAVLTTGACCRSEATLRRLWHMATSYCHHDHQVVDGSPLWSIANIYNAVYMYSVKSAQLYRKVLDTLLLPADAWANAYRDWGYASQRHNTRPPVLVIGDRYDKDIYPAMRAFGAVYTLRILRGKYSHTWREAHLKNHRRPAPWSTVTTLWDAITKVDSIRFAEPGDSSASAPVAARSVITPTVMRALAILERQFGEEGKGIADTLSWRGSWTG